MNSLYFVEISQNDYFKVIMRSVNVFPLKTYVGPW